MPALARRLCLTAILAIAIAARTYRLAWGLPEFIFNDTRLHFLRATLHITTAGDWALHWFVHPPLYPYAVSLVAVMWSTLTGNEIRMSGPGSVADHAMIVLLGRWLTATLAALLVGALYLLARRLLGTRAALLAALLFALGPLHVLENHRINVDTPMLLLAVLSAHQAAIAVQERRTSALFFSFALAAAAGCAKYTGLYAGTLPLWIALTWPGDWKSRARLLVSGGVVSAIALALLLSPVLLNWDRFIKNVVELFHLGMYSGAPTQNLEGTSWVYVPYLYVIFVGLPFMLGWPVYLMAIAGLVSLAAGDRKVFSHVAASTVPYFILQGGAETATARYYLPLAPHLTIAAAAAMTSLRKYSVFFGNACIAIVVAYSALLVGSQLSRLDGAPQIAIGQALQNAAAEKGGRTAKSQRLMVAYPEWTAHKYDAILPHFQRRNIRIAFFAQWLRAIDPDPDPYSARVTHVDWLERRRIDAVVLPNRWRAYVLRKREENHETRFYENLINGSLGYEKVADEASRFFTQSLYDWADPALSTTWVAGIEGYELYLRFDLAEKVRAARRRHMSQSESGTRAEKRRRGPGSSPM